MRQCVYCVAEWHNECDEPVEDNDETQCCCSNLTVEIGVIEGGRPRDKAIEDIQHITATGRKRAAAMYPMDKNAPCEWQQLKFAGGGVEPIIGCLNGKQQARHHGPDKSVMNNVQRNVHLLCHTCHNRWHSRNDKYYGERPPNGESFIPIDREMLEHDYTTPATELEMVQAEIEWLTTKEPKETEREVDNE